MHYKIATGITSCSNATNGFIYTVSVVNEVESVELSLYCTSEEWIFVCWCWLAVTLFSCENVVAHQIHLHTKQVYSRMSQRLGMAAQCVQPHFRDNISQQWIKIWKSVVQAFIQFLFCYMLWLSGLIFMCFT